MRDNASRADNQQEMLKKNFYFSGFMAGEMSCSIIKRTNHGRGYYYEVDFTVTNADRQLLAEVNRIVMNNRGLITPVKHAYNLSARGKDKVRTVLNFLEHYPIITGDLARNRIVILKTALMYLENHHGRVSEKTVEMEKLRRKLKELKFDGKIDKSFGLAITDRNSLGYFFAGVIDGEGSFGIKTSGSSKEPFFVVAMKDKKIIETLCKFVGYGNVRLRKDGVYSIEINRRSILKDICELFLNQHPLRHEGQRKRLLTLQQLLNDYTPKPGTFWDQKKVAGYDIV